MSTAETIFNSYPNSFAAPSAAAATQAPAGGSLFARFGRALDRWSQSSAESRAQARLWNIAQSDPRILSKLMQARARDQSESAESAEAAVANDAPAFQGVGVLLEHAYQSRLRTTHMDTL